MLAEIKQSDPNPDIKAFTIAHNGAVDIVLNGIKTPVQWIRSAVRWIKNALVPDTPVFQHHGAPGDNSHDGRVPIGKVIGSKIVEEGSKIATIAAMYIFPQFRHLNLDVASIEADIHYSRNGNVVYPTSVEQVTGVALANSSMARPGFPGATMLGAIQAFANQKDISMPTSVEEVKELVVSLGITPEQLYSKEELVTSKVIVDHVRKEKKDTYEHAKRVQEEKEELQVKFDTQKSDYEKKLSEATKNALIARSGNVFSAVAQERKLEDIPKKFIEKRLPAFTTEATDDVKMKEDLNKFIDGQLKEFEEVQVLLGVKKPDETPPGTPPADKPPVIPPASTPQYDGSDDMPFRDQMNPDTNPLIPGGKADQNFTV